MWTVAPIHNGQGISVIYRKIFLYPTFYSTFKVISKFIFRNVYYKRKEPARGGILPAKV